MRVRLKKGCDRQWNLVVGETLVGEEMQLFGLQRVYIRSSFIVDIEAVLLY